MCDTTITPDIGVFTELFHAIARVLPPGAIISMTRSRRFRVVACVQRNDFLRIWIVVNNKRKFIVMHHHDLDETTLAQLKQRPPRGGKVYVKIPDAFSVVLELIRARCFEKAYHVGGCIEAEIGDWYAEAMKLFGP